jgi:hypothetical protein
MAVEFGQGAGHYSLAYRFYNSRRDVFSGMSLLADVSFGLDPLEASSRGFAYWTAASPPDLLNLDPEGGWDRIQTFRTIREGARLYWEDTFEPGETPEWGRVMSDAALQGQERYEPFLDAVGAPRRSRRLTFYNDVVVMESDRGILYSPTHKYQPELMPASHLVRVDSGDMPVVEFVKAGDYLWALCASLSVRCLKQGTVFSSNDMHHGYGPQSRSAAVAVGASVMALTTGGIMRIAPDGQPGKIVWANRLFLPQVPGNWVADIVGDYKAARPVIHAAVDDLIGAIVWTNTRLAEAIVWWTDQQRATWLEQVPWSLSCTGSDPVAGGPRRAFFYGVRVPDSPDTDFHARLDTVWTIDALMEAGTQTMFGLPAGTTVNGFATSASSGSTLVRAGANWPAGCLGAFVNVFTAAGRKASRVVSVGAGALTLYPSVGAIAAGDRFHLSPIPLIVTGSMVDGNGAQPDLGVRRVTTDMSLQIGRPAPSAGTVVRMCMVGEDGETELEAVEVDASLDFDEMHAHVPAEGRAVFPKIECWASDEPLEIISMRVKFRRGDSDVD